MKSFKFITNWGVPIVCAIIVNVFYLKSNYEMMLKSLIVSLVVVFILAMIYDYINNKGTKKEIEKPFEE